MCQKDSGERPRVLFSYMGLKDQYIREVVCQLKSKPRLEWAQDCALSTVYTKVGLALHDIVKCKKVEFITVMWPSLCYKGLFMLCIQVLFLYSGNV